MAIRTTTLRVRTFEGSKVFCFSNIGVPETIRFDELPPYFLSESIGAKDVPIAIWRGKVGNLIDVGWAGYRLEPDGWEFEGFKILSFKRKPMQESLPMQPSQFEELDTIELGVSWEVIEAHLLRVLLRNKEWPPVVMVNEPA